MGNLGHIRYDIRGEAKIVVVVASLRIFFAAFRFIAPRVPRSRLLIPTLGKKQEWGAFLLLVFGGINFSVVFLSIALSLISLGNNINFHSSRLIKRILPSFRSGTKYTEVNI